MGFFERLFGRLPVPSGQARGYFKTLTAYSPVFTSWSGSIYESALVRSAIDAKARNIGKLKITVQGAAKPKLQAKLRKAPNDFQTWYQFLSRLEVILEMQTTAFIVPVLDEYGETSGIYPVLPSRCTLLDYGGQPWLSYQFGSGQKAAIELNRCGIMVKMQYKDDIFGDGNGALYDTMNLMSLNSQGIKEAVKNSNTFRFMAKLGNFAKEEDIQKERSRFSKSNLAGDDGGGILLFPNTWSDIKQITSSPYTVDAAQVEQIRTNVCDYFGVNDDVLQNKLYGDSWSSFYEGAIEPFAIQLSEVLTRMLFTEFERANGTEVFVTANRLQYMSFSDKLNYVVQLSDRGMINRDEGREVFNLPPLPDGAGQEYTIRGEYKNANEVNEGGNNNE